MLSRTRFLAPDSGCPTSAPSTVTNKYNWIPPWLFGAGDYFLKSKDACKDENSK